MKFIFDEQEKNVMFLHPKEGHFSTSVCGANVYYRFEYSSEFCLNVPNQLLDGTDIDDLIDFLQAAKEHLK